MVHPQLKDHAWLRQQYESAGLSTVQIAESLGVSPQSVQYQLRRAGVKMRGRWSGRWKPKACAACGEEFVPSGPAAKFCSETCQFGVAECRGCGSEYLKRPRGGGMSQEFCSRRCWYAHKSDDDGTRRIGHWGYVLVKVPAGTPGVEGDRRWMKEHRWVMQESLGRPLDPSETVHHINGDKTDNRLENLQLRQGRHGKGARFVCNDCGSHNVAAVSL